MTMTMLQRLGAALLLLAAALTPASAAERITQFVSDVHVQRNGDLEVAETIAVMAEGQTIKRGFLRDFPTSYANRDGTRVEVDFDVHGVTRNGAPEPFAVERLANGYRIRIGSADKVLEFGVHTYVITYRTTRQIGFFAGFDELYWNATGTGWTMPIEMAEARITLPENVPFRQVAFYTGPQGAKDRDANIVKQDGGTIVFRITKPLPARSGLTVAAGWEKGLIAAPSSLDRAGHWLRDNLPLGATVFGLALLLGYYIYAWHNVGRDPRAGTIVPLFGPPKGMSAAAVRYVSQMGFDNKAFTAAVIELGVRGHIKLVETEGGMKIVPRGSGKPLGAPEQAVAASLFGERKSPIELEPENHAIFKGAREALHDSLTAAYAGKLFQDHTSWSLLGLLASLALIAIVLLSVFVGWGSEAGVAVLCGQVSLIPAVFVACIVAFTGLPRSVAGVVFLAFGCVFASLFGIGNYEMITEGHHGWVNLVPASVPLIVIPIASSAFSWMKAHTREGRRITDQIEGFRQYLGVAEEDRLNALNPPEKTPELFEKFLPYAVALDVENAWAAKFETLLAAAPATDMTETWYSARRDKTNTPAALASYFGEELTQTIASASTPPGSSGSSSGSDSSSSGSSGGGSSGGGGGGGGGSGW
jgi:uncharacterized membrane protein YgcG